MNILPPEIQSLIIEEIKCHCINVCKTWEKMINKPNDDLITYIINKDYYAIQFIYFNYPLKSKEKEIINVAIIMNDSLVFKIILKTIYKMLPETDSIIMYFRIDKENSDIINTLIKHIIVKGNYKALRYFLEIHNSSGFPDDLTYMSDISNIIDVIKKIKDYQFEHFIMIDYLMGLSDIDWCDDDIKFITKILSSSFDKFYKDIRSKKTPNTIKFVMLMDKLINKQKIRTRKNIVFVKEDTTINNKKAYLECIRHGLHNVIKNMPSTEILLINDNNEFVLFLLSLSGNCKIKDIIKFYHVDYLISYNEELIKDCINKERYDELLSLITFT